MNFDVCSISILNVLLDITGLYLSRCIKGINDTFKIKLFVI